MYSSALAVEDAQLHALFVFCRACGAVKALFIKFRLVLVGQLVPHLHLVVGYATMYKYKCAYHLSFSYSEWSKWRGFDTNIHQILVQQH